MEKVEEGYATTEGIVISRKSAGLDDPTYIGVRYKVKGKEYEIKESLKYKSEIIKLAFLPIGQRKTFKLENAYVGESLVVCYKLGKPEKAYLRDNRGSMNI